MSDTEIKVEPPIRREFLKVKAIRLYPRVEDVTYYVNSTVERNEQPKFLVKAVWSPKRQAYEIEIAFMGSYHSENAGYYTKSPEKWSTWGEYVLSPEQAKEFVEILSEMQDAIAQHNGNTKQAKIVQTKIGYTTTIFDLSWYLNTRQPCTTHSNYPYDVNKLLSLFGYRKIIALLKGAKRNG
jgi:hypothetical protein